MPRPTSLQVQVFLEPPRALWQAPAEEGLRPGPRPDLEAAPRQDPVEEFVTEAVRLKAREEPVRLKVREEVVHLKVQQEPVRLKAQEEPVTRGVDPKNSHEDKDKLKNDPDVATHVRPSRGPDPVPRLRRPPSTS